MTKIIPPALFVIAIIMAAFLCGVLVAHYQFFPYRDIRDAGRTMKALLSSQSAYSGERIEATKIPANDVPNKRWTLLDKTAPRLPVIAFGGLNQYLELCPYRGCLAVTYNAEGLAEAVWPYRPADIFANDITQDRYRHEMLLIDPSENTKPIDVIRYANNDILVTFQRSWGSFIFPFGMGVARIKQDGSPNWRRSDFSHHWSHLKSEGTALVPGLWIVDQTQTFDPDVRIYFDDLILKCDTGRPQLDTVQMIDSKGELVDEIDLVPMFLESNWKRLIYETTDSCDPLHLNYIDEIEENEGAGLRAGDLVVSLRNISAFAVFDPKTRTLKRVVRGGFIQQHSVQHLSDGKFLVFDNLGGDLEGPGSRIVELDLVSGAERRIFPNAHTPKPYSKVFSPRAGHIDISPDKSRILASFTHDGRVFEVDLASGKLLAVFDNIHDTSSLPDELKDAQPRAVRFSIFGMRYLRD